jgi:hypothetical protein
MGLLSYGSSEEQASRRFLKILVPKLTFHNDDKRVFLLLITVSTGFYAATELAWNAREASFRGSDLPARDRVCGCACAGLRNGDLMNDKLDWFDTWNFQSQRNTRLLSISEKTALSALELSDRLLEEVTRKSLPDEAVREAGEVPIMHWFSRFSRSLPLSLFLISQMFLSPKQILSDRSVDRSSSKKKSSDSKKLLSEADALEEKEHDEVLRAATLLAQKEKQAKEVIDRKSVDS